MRGLPGGAESGENPIMPDNYLEACHYNKPLDVY